MILTLSSEFRAQINFVTSGSPHNSRASGRSSFVHLDKPILSEYKKKLLVISNLSVRSYPNRLA